MDKKIQLYKVYSKRKYIFMFCVNWLKTGIVKNSVAVNALNGLDLSVLKLHYLQISIY